MLPLYFKFTSRGRNIFNEAAAGQWSDLIIPDAVIDVYHKTRYAIVANPEMEPVLINRATPIYNLEAIDCSGQRMDIEEVVQGGKAEPLETPWVECMTDKKEFLTGMTIAFLQWCVCCAGIIGASLLNTIWIWVYAKKFKMSYS